jgi:hypothetical protein
VVRRLRSMGIRDRPTAPRSPWQNGYCERLIGSIRRECLDHVVVFGEPHLRHLRRSYANYYNQFPDAPIPEQGFSGNPPHRGRRPYSARANPGRIAPPIRPDLVSDRDRSARGAHGYPRPGPLRISWTILPGAPVTMALLVGCCRRARLHFRLDCLEVSTANHLPAAHEPRAVRPPMAPQEFNPHIHRSATASLATSQNSAR